MHGDNGGGREEGLWTLALVLAFLGFAFAGTVIGAVEPWAQAVMGATGVAALLAAAFAGRLHPLPGGEPGRVRLLPPEAFLLALLALGVLQCIPLPVELHRVLSPEGGRVFDRGLPPGEEERWRTLSVYPWATRVELLRLAALGAVFSLMARGIRRTSEARFAAAGFTALGGAAALLGLADGATGGELLGYYPREGIFRDRLAGVLVNPNHFAGMMEMTALAALGLGFSLTAPEEGEGGEEAGGRGGFRALLLRGFRRGTGGGALLALVFVLLIAVAALLLTGSRFGGFAFLAGLGALTALLSRGGHGVRMAGAMAAVTALLLAANASLAGDPVLGRWTLFFGGEDSSAAGRLHAWQAVASMGGRFPVTGCGLGVFGHLFPAYQPEGLGGTWDHAHNDFLELFVETGFPGLLLLLGGLAAWLSGAARAAMEGPWRRRGVAAGCTAAVVALLVHGTADFNFQIPGNAWMAAALAGVAYGLRGRRSDPGPEPRRPSDPAA